MRITRQGQSVADVEIVVLGLCSLFTLVLSFDATLGVNIADYTISASVGLVLLAGLYYRSKKGRQDTVNKV